MENSDNKEEILDHLYSDFPEVVTKYFRGFIYNLFFFSVHNNIKSNLSPFYILFFSLFTLLAFTYVTKNSLKHDFIKCHQHLRETATKLEHVSKVI